MQKKNRFDIRFLVLFFLIAIVLVAGIFFYIYYRDAELELKQRYGVQLKKEYQIVVGVYAHTADFIYQQHINKPEIKEIFARGVRSENPEQQQFYRTKLYQKLLPLYQTMGNYDFRQLHFHDKNNHSYLRFYRSEKYGDNLTAFRHAIKYVNHYKRHFHGFEEGRVFNGYRFIYPIQYQGEHLGSVEVSISMKTVIQQFHESFRKKIGFLLRDQVINNMFPEEQKNYTPWDIDSQYFFNHSIQEELIFSKSIFHNNKTRIKRYLEQNQQSKKLFYLEVEGDQGGEILTFLPIYNFQNQNVASIVALFDGKDLIRRKRNFYIVSLLLALLLLLLTIFIIHYQISQRKIEYFATIDTLTDVYIRGVLMEMLQKDLHRFKRYQIPFTIVMLDIDHFKRVNDTYGHQAGDDVLSTVTQLLKHSIRNTDYIGRYGGEEFIVVLPGISAKQGEIVAEKLRGVIEEHHFEKVERVTISCGVMVASEKITSIKEMIDQADQKLYRAKEAGRNRVII